MAAETAAKKRPGNQGPDLKTCPASAGTIAHILKRIWSADPKTTRAAAKNCPPRRSPAAVLQNSKRSSSGQNCWPPRITSTERSANDAASTAHVAAGHGGRVFRSVIGGASAGWPLCQSQG